MKNVPVERQSLYKKVRLLANSYRFRIVELTIDNDMSITYISKALKLSYTKCSDYVRFLENEGILQKERCGREVYVKSIIKLKDDEIKF